MIMTQEPKVVGTKEEIIDKYELDQLKDVLNDL